MKCQEVEDPAPPLGTACVGYMRRAGKSFSVSDRLLVDLPYLFAEKPSVIPVTKVCDCLRPLGFGLDDVTNW
jgi:hypothetical protein